MDYLGEIIALGIDSVLFGVCCRLYIKQCNYIEAVQNAESLDIKPGLEETVHSQPQHRLPYVAIRGAVKALGTPITSVNNQNITGTIQKLSVKEHVVARGSAGYWADQERVIQEVCNSVPFVLQASRSSVEILDALRSDILDLETIADRFEPSNPSAFDHIWGFFAGVRRRGVQTTEEMLREGTYITGIGELMLQSNGDGLKLQAPANGSPYYLTVLPISSLIKKLDDQRRVYRLLTVVFGSMGLIIFGIIARHWWRERMRKMQEDLLKRQLEASRKERRKRVRDTTNVPESQLCIVCNINPREIILLPCGHVCICEDCSEDITNNCPVCRAKIEKKAAAYIS